MRDSDRLRTCYRCKRPFAVDDLVISASRVIQTEPLQLFAALDVFVHDHCPTPTEPAAHV